MKKLLLLALITAFPSMHAFCGTAALANVFFASAALVTEGASILLAETGDIGVSIGQGIGGYIGSASGVMFGSDIGAAAGSRMVQAAGQHVQHLPQEQRLGVAAGLIAVGYVISRYGSRIVLGIPL